MVCSVRINVLNRPFTADKKEGKMSTYKKIGSNCFGEELFLPVQLSTRCVNSWTESYGSLEPYETITIETYEILHAGSRVGSYARSIGHGAVSTIEIEPGKLTGFNWRIKSLEGESFYNTTQGFITE